VLTNLGINANKAPIPVLPGLKRILKTAPTAVLKTLRMGTVLV
jgi:hypothetical protein